MGNVPPGSLPENYESLVLPPSASAQAPPSAQAQAQAPRPPPASTESEATSAGNTGEWLKTDGKIIPINDRRQDKWDDKSKFFKDPSCNILLVVEFRAQWSGPSRFISPFIERLAEANKNVVVFLRVNYDSMEEVASEEGVDVVPTYLLYKYGQLQQKIVGARRFELSAKIDELKKATI